MNHLRLLCSHRARRWRTILGLAAMTIALATVSQAAADAKGGPKDQKGHHDPAKPMPSNAPHGGSDKPGMPHGGPHAQGPGGAPGFDPRHHGQPPEALKKRIEELKQKGDKLSADEKQELERLTQPMPGRRVGHARKARLAELKEKESSGKLSAEEKTELEQAQKLEAKHEELEKNKAERLKDRKDRSREAKRRALKEMPNLDKNAPALAEYRKHAERLAKLERAKELASADENAAMVQKIDALIAKENQRHQAWLAKNPTSKATQGGAQ